MYDRHSQPRPPRSARRATACASVGTLAAGLLLAGCGSVGVDPLASARLVPTAAPTTSLRGGLIVRGHAQRVAGTLTGGVRVSGTLYPALPGANTLRLRVVGPDGGDADATGRAEVAAVMPGMAMRATTTVLTGHAGWYQGTIALPMFGRYAARLVVLTPRGRRHGTLVLEMPLALGT